MSIYLYNVGDKVYHKGEEAIIQSQEGVNTMGESEYHILYSDTSKGDFYVMESELAPRQRTSYCPILNPGSSNVKPPAGNFTNTPSGSVWNPLKRFDEPKERSICECGQALEQGVKHSTWCKLYRKGVLG